MKPERPSGTAHFVAHGRALGLESGIVRVVPYDSSWPELYAKEVARITPVLAAHGVRLLLEHTGSTAVPGLAAKPILDLLAGRSRDQGMSVKGAPHGRAEPPSFPIAGQLGMGDAALFLVPRWRDRARYQ